MYRSSDHFDTDKKTAVTQTAYYPVDLVPVHAPCFFYIINIAQSMWAFYTTLIHQAGGQAIFFYFAFICIDLPELFILLRISSPPFTRLPDLKVWRIRRLFLACFDILSYIKKGFNIRQENLIQVYLLLGQ